MVGKNICSPQRSKKYDKLLILSFYFKSDACGVLGKGVLPQ